MPAAYQDILTAGERSANRPAGDRRRIGPAVWFGAWLVGMISELWRRALWRPLELGEDVPAGPAENK